MIDDHDPGPSDEHFVERERRSNGAATPSPTSTVPRAHTVRVSDVEAKAVDWLWPGRLPAGMVTLLDGAQKAGKSTVVIDLVARLTTGRPWPNEVGALRPPADVVLLGHEDSPEHTIRPRLDAAGADPERVHLLMNVGGRLPRLPEDVDEIERVLLENKARLLVIDPISAYIGDVDLYRDNEVRAALTPLVNVAERTGATVLMLRHLRKSGGVDAINRGGGSVAIAALARAMLMLLRDPEDDEARILTWPGINVAREPPALRLRWLAGEGAPRIEWVGTCDLTADDILSRQDRDRAGGKKTDHAEAWLRQQLANGPRPGVEVQDAARAAGISITGALKRAREAIAVTEKRFAGGWWWRLKDQGEQRPPVAPHAPLAPLALLQSEQSEQEEQDHKEGTALLAHVDLDDGEGEE